MEDETKKGFLYYWISNLQWDSSAAGYWLAQNCSSSAASASSRHSNSLATEGMKAAAVDSWYQSVSHCLLLD